LRKPQQAREALDIRRAREVTALHIVDAGGGAAELL
jgi:hypothetical protein